MKFEPIGWSEWHQSYDDTASPLSWHLAVVQAQLRRALPADPDSDGPIRDVSICAGQGHDLPDVLEEYPHADRVQARLVELDGRNVWAARRRAAALGLRGLRGVEVPRGDAALLSAYEGAVPADIMLACGVFGNVGDADIFRTIDLLPQLCRLGATVIWTRIRRAPDLTPAIRRHFAERSFVEVEFVAPERVQFCVGSHRFAGTSEPLLPERRMFTFVAPKG